MSYCQMLRPTQTEGAERPLLPVAWAVAALALLLLWQFLTVRYNRAGNWTALFLTGQNFQTPPDLASKTYHFPGNGYDGELYRVVAHDPFNRHGSARYLDGPAQRYHRILIPTLAYLLVAGHQPWIDGSYIAVVDLFVFLGAYWLSVWAVRLGAHPAWALAFLLDPASIISMDRMTVDVALAALTVGFAVYWTTASWTKVFVILLLAALVRETGLLLVAGACLYELLNRRFARVVLCASAALPMLAWYILIRHRFAEKTHYGVPTWFANKVGPGLFFHLLQPPHYPLPPLLEAIARFSDALALGCVFVASLLAILCLRARPWSAVGLAAVFFAALVFLLTSAKYWSDVNGYARVISPLFILVALLAASRKTGWNWPWWIGIVPILGVDLRLSLEFTSAIGGVIHGLLHV
jgi:hypothetical protein